eukprot:9198-Heterococcus_DN1.PRE.2
MLSNAASSGAQLVTAHAQSLYYMPESESRKHCAAAVMSAVAQRKHICTALTAEHAHSECTATTH